MSVRVRRASKGISTPEQAGRVGAAMRMKASGGGIAELREALGLTRKLFSRLTGYSERAIAEWEGGKQLGDASRQRIARCSGSNRL